MKAGFRLEAPAEAPLLADDGGEARPKPRGVRAGWHDRDGSSSGEPFDPLARALAAQAPFLDAQATSASSAQALPRELDQVVNQLVRRASWAGDKRRGAARIELGSGELAGATLLVQSDQNEVKVDLELPPGAACELWRERIAQRLAARGLTIRELNVH